MPTDDEWNEAESLADSLPGRPLARTPEEGVKQMTRRIACLEEDIRRWESPETGPELSAQAPKQISLLKSELTIARQCLAEYQAQLKGRN